MAANQEVVANPYGSFDKPESTESSAVAKSDEARAIKEVEAAMVIAKRFPRNQMAATDKIIQMCTRQGLAETGMYSYAKGGSSVSGPSIRLAEAMAQAWGNMQFGIRELSQSNGESTVEAFAWDMESNTKQHKVFQVPHLRFTKNGSYQLTDPREIYELIANQGARRLRNCILGVIPGDVVEAAVQQCETTLHTQADVSPEAIQKMVGAFEAYNVTREQIEKWAQCRMDAIRPAQVVKLRKIYNSLKDGMSAPGDWFDVVVAEGGDADAPGKSRSESVKDKARGKSAGKGKAEKPASDAPSAGGNDSGDEGAVTYAEIANAINAAGNAKAVEQAMEMAAELPADQRDELAGLANGKLQSFNAE